MLVLLLKVSCIKKYNCQMKYARNMDKEKINTKYFMHKKMTTQPIN